MESHKNVTVHPTLSVDKARRPTIILSVMCVRVICWCRGDCETSAVTESWVDDEQSVGDHVTWHVTWPLSARWRRWLWRRRSQTSSGRLLGMSRRLKLLPLPIASQQNPPPTVS